LNTPLAQTFLLPLESMLRRIRPVFFIPGGNVQVFPILLLSDKRAKLIQFPSISVTYLKVSMLPALYKVGKD
jgi:hypothetical protein